MIKLTSLFDILDLVFIERRSKMLNKVKTKALISVGTVAATSFILMMGYTAGQHSTAKQSRKEIELAAAKLVEDKQAEDKASILSSDTVEECLTQYYTKEKLGEIIHV